MNNQPKVISAIFLILLIGVGGVFGKILNPCGAEPCIQIGTFNIEWLGGTKHKPRSRKVIRQIASLIAKRLELEVVVLQEINTSSHEYRWLAEELDKFGYRLRHAGEEAEQDIVLAFNDKVVLESSVSELSVRDEFDLPGNCRTSRKLRLPVVAKLRSGEFDFVIIGVHLKSQRPTENAANPQRCSDEIREAQAKDIRDEIPKLMAQSGDRDIIVAGDFNAPVDDFSIRPLLESTKFESLFALGNRHSLSNSYSYIPIKYRDLIDHLMINPETTTEWVNKSSFILNPPKDSKLLDKYLEWQSDHLPVWASFRTSSDDD